MKLSFKILLTLYTLVMLLFTAKITFQSKIDSHPDEKYHIFASEYYELNNLPPKFDSPKINHTYSKEGYSRLNYVDFSHYLSGKVASFFELGKTKHRIFNYILMLIISCRFIYLVFKNRNEYLLYLFLLIFPQAWYIFGYVNDDATPLFVSFIIIEYYVYFVRNDNNLFSSLSLGGLLGLLYLSKNNNLIFIIFILSLLLYKVYQTKNYKLIWAPISGIVVVSLRYGLNMIINNTLYLERKIEAIRLLTANEEYINSAKYLDTFFMYSQGISLSKLIFEMNWFQLSAYSFIGLFEKMSFFLNQNYYRIFLVILFCLILNVLIRMIKGFNVKLRTSIILYISILSIFLMIGASFYHSYTFDFQPQGRYLFPILPIVGFTLYYYRPKFNLLTKFLYGILLVMAIGGYGYYAFSF